MALLVSGTNNNWTSSSTWRQVAAATGAANDTETGGGSTTLTTSPVASSAFVLAAEQVDAVAVKVSTRGASASPTNTMTVELYNSTTAAVAGTCTIDVADIPANATGGTESGWYCFVFSGGAITPNGTDSYTVRCYLSSTSPSVALFRDSTAANWLRLIRRTSTVAPAAADKLFVMGEFTGTGGAGSTFTVTMDENSTTAYGTAGTFRAAPAVSVSKRGVLTFSTAANTQLRVSGWLEVYSGGVLNIGTVASPIPRAYTAILEFVPPGDGISGVVGERGSTVTMQGESPTSGKSIVWTLMTANASSGVNTVTVADDTGWKSGQVVAIASTSRTRTHTDLMTLNGDAGASSLTFTGNTTNAHLGTAPVKQAEVVLLTRNVKYRSTSTTLMTCMIVNGSWDVDWVEFRYFSSNTNAIEIFFTTATPPPAASFEYCAFYDMEESVFDISQTSSAIGSLICKHSVAYNICTSGGGSFMSDGIGITSASATFWLDDIVIINSSYRGLSLNSPERKKFTNIRVAGAADYGIVFGSTSAGGGSNLDVGKTHGPWVVHACTNPGILFYTGWPIIGQNFAAITSWYNSSYGVQFSVTGQTSGAGGYRNWVFDSITAFGNTQNNISVGSASFVNVRIKTLTLDGDATFTTLKGIEFGSGAVTTCDVWIDAATFGATTPHTQYDIYVDASQAGNIHLNFGRASFSGTLGSVYWVTGTLASDDTAISVGRFNGVDGDTRVFHQRGILQAEHTIAETDPSLKMSPTTAAYKLDSAAGRRRQGFLVGTLTGQTKTVSVRVRKDGTYNGSQPRLIRKATPATILNDEDEVLDTAAASADTWETLTGTTPAAAVAGVFEFVVDCDGTAGAIYVDSWDA